MTENHYKDAVNQTRANVYSIEIKRMRRSVVCVLIFDLRKHIPASVEQRFLWYKDDPGRRDHALEYSDSVLDVNRGETFNVY